MKPQPADILLIHGTRLFKHAIWAEHLDRAYYDHMCAVNRDGLIVNAVFPRVRRLKPSVYLNEKYDVMILRPEFADAIAKEKFLRRLDRFHGLKYDWRRGFFFVFSLIFSRFLKWQIKNPFRARPKQRIDCTDSVYFSLCAADPRFRMQNISTSNSAKHHLSPKDFYEMALSKALPLHIIKT